MQSEIQLLCPTPDDASEMHQLASTTTLDTNSPYAYLLIARDFGQWSLVARDGDGMIGFLAAYLRPTDPSTYFVWQVAVSERARGRGIARHLIEHGFASSGARWLEATVTPDNAASAALFRGVARRAGIPCSESPLFSREVFPAGSGHEPEILFRLGPLPER